MPAAKLCLTLTVVVAASLAVAAQVGKPDPLATLPPVVQKALNSSHIRYTGTRTVQFGSGPRAHSHVEVILHDGDRTRVEFPEGSPLAGQVIVEDGKQRMRYFPRKNQIEMLPPRNDVTMVRLAKFMRTALNRGWRIYEASASQVAGINAEEVCAETPAGKVRQRFWIDSNTGMILKRVICDDAGAIKGSFEFTKIDYRPHFTDREFSMDRRGVAVVTPELKSKRLAARNGFDQTILPADSGFRLESARMARVGGDWALCQLYSGTGGEFSLFHLKRSVDPTRLQRIAGGRLKVVTWERNGETLALVGDIDESKLKEISRKLGGP